MYVGVPTIIGAGGIEKIVDIKLTKDEQAMFDKSVEAVKGLDACKGIDTSLGNRNDSYSWPRAQQEQL